MESIGEKDMNLRGKGDGKGVKRDRERENEKWSREDGRWKGEATGREEGKGREWK